MAVESCGIIVGRAAFRDMAVFLLASVACARLAADDVAKEGEEVLKKAAFSVGAEVSSGYLASSGAVCDTRPVSSQEVDWKFDLGRYGWIDGYGWTISALHGRQHAVHREPFNEFEGALHYGYDLALAEEVSLSSFAGMLWNPQMGYPRTTNRYWGEHFGMSLRTPFATPYWSALALQQPSPRTRTRIGIRRSFAVLESVSVTPSVETVWGDVRRYRTRYGEEPRHRFLHGAFMSVTTGVKAEWRMTERLCVYAKARQFDVVDGQARRLVKDKTRYYDRRDLALFALGVTYDF